MSWVSKRRNMVLLILWLHWYSPYGLIFAVSGQTSRWKELHYRVLCTAGTAASMRAIKMGKPLWRVARSIWLTAVPGPTVTLHALPSGTSSLGRRWMWSSSSCTWVLMFRRWHNNRAWSPVNFWGCWAVVARKGSPWRGRMIRSL